MLLIASVNLRLEVPIDDTPFNQRHGLEPSMEQSLALAGRPLGVGMVR